MKSIGTSLNEIIQFTGMVKSIREINAKSIGLITLGMSLFIVAYKSVDKLFSIFDERQLTKEKEAHADLVNTVGNQLIKAQVVELAKRKAKLEDKNKNNCNKELSAEDIKLVKSETPTESIELLAGSFDTLNRFTKSNFNFDLSKVSERKFVERDNFGGMEGAKAGHVHTFSGKNVSYFAKANALLLASKVTQGQHDILYLEFYKSDPESIDPESFNKIEYIENTNDLFDTVSERSYSTPEVKGGIIFIKSDLINKITEQVNVTDGKKLLVSEVRIDDYNQLKEDLEKARKEALQADASADLKEFDIVESGKIHDSIYIAHTEYVKKLIEEIIRNREAILDESDDLDKSLEKPATTSKFKEREEESVVFVSDLDRDENGDVIEVDPQTSRTNNDV